jgi:ubiquinone/menaquinone biosynthesis C-methylase UbiE
VSSADARQPQLAYSDVQAKMLDEAHRRTKAGKILSVLHHFLGRVDLRGLTAVDIGCSAGFIADELAADGARTIGLDIDAPGLVKAHARFGDHVDFLGGSGDQLPFVDDSIDVVVFNHIYEHVVDADAVLREIHRVLKKDGVAYLGLANKFQLIEPHYRLPFLSWLPQRVADAYIRRAGKADGYYEKHLSRSDLKTLLRGFHVWDYTVAVIRAPQVFGSGDQVGATVSRTPAPVLRAGLPLAPTFIWVATKGDARPAATAGGADDVVHLDLTGRTGPA